MLSPLLTVRSNIQCHCCLALITATAAGCCTVSVRKTCFSRGHDRRDALFPSRLPRVPPISIDHLWYTRIVEPHPKQFRSTSLGSYTNYSPCALIVLCLVHILIRLLAARFGIRISAGPRDFSLFRKPCGSSMGPTQISTQNA